MSETPAPPPPQPQDDPKEPKLSSRSAELSSRPPRAGYSSLGTGDPMVGGVDRVARIQTIAAVVLGLALIAIPLYLWRRPRSETLPVTSTTMLDASAPFGDAGQGAAALTAPALATPVTLSEAKVMECHDTGAKRTRPEDCDHLLSVEKAFAAAIVGGGPCLPTSSGGGTLVYILDASFGRKRHPFELLIPRDGRSLKSSHGMAAAVNACAAAVKRGLEGMTLEGVPHGHARYKIAITATYPAATAPL